ncbi:hypothetical protein HKX48_003626 [Thoreauomyces humboldtii]|nr:hypothetical protein HKX48_003626 [Thoreauomyces humboldtii]
MAPTKSTSWSLKKTKGPAPESQKIFVNVPVPSAQAYDDRGRPTQTFPTNAVYTAKYHALTFLPLNLFEQFRRVANLYFLGLTVLQCIPKYQTINPIVAALPLVVIVLLTSVKDGFEDWRRHASDAEMNGTIAWCIRGGGWTNANQCFFKGGVSAKKKATVVKGDGKVSPTVSSLDNLEAATHTVLPQQVKSGIDNGAESAATAWTATPWAEVQTGDLILLKDNTPVPADMVILATSEPDALCYVETKNLDGETNLKIRQGVAQTNALLSSPEALDDLRDLKCVVECEPPNNSLYTFTGTLLLPPDSNAAVKGPVQIPLSVQNTLLRGCYLRNTSWTIGLAVQTGANTKIRQNAGITPMKRSRTERGMNGQVLVNLGVLLIICIVTAIVNPEWEIRHSKTSPIWLDWTYTGVAGRGSASLDAFGNSLIIYQNVVPLSLYITLEIVKTMQAYFIYEDAEMFYPPSHRCIPRSWAIADDLGQIEHVFSDKTGTLTRNIMEFKKFSVAGVVYGEGLGVEDNGNGDPVQQAAAMRVVDASRPAFWDDLLELHLGVRDTHQYQHLEAFFLALAVCHSVLVGAGDPPAYKASSPDEAALVSAARSAGWAFHSRDAEAVCVKTPTGEIVKYKLLHVLEFNSTRKRMSVVVREPGGRVLVMCKGADSVIWERLRLGQETLREVTGVHLEYFAEEGLRTLCISQAYIEEPDYEQWAAAYRAASISLTDREGRMDAVAEDIEQSLELLGATAIEDKLQDGVPETIATLMSAGIKVWVLTGDKMETAINIGFACNLLTREMRLILVRGSDDEGAIAGGAAGAVSQLTSALATFFSENDTKDAPNATAGKIASDLEDGGAGPEHLQDPAESEASSTALVIDGAALAVTLSDPTGRAELLRLSTRCASVICCRVSPLQKAQIVTLVKTAPTPAENRVKRWYWQPKPAQQMCLAIGDGANDVSMIQAAHIGVGIAGEEGLQAAMAADYAIAQFRFLARLLLVHGRWSYRRTSEMILCFFFKNIIWVMVLFWFQFWCGFSALSLYDFTYTLLYNVVFTALPVICLGVFDQDLNERYVLLVPPVYPSDTKWVFSYWRFVVYMTNALFQSVVICLTVVWTFADGAAWSNGRAGDLEVMGATAAIVAVLNANAVVIVNTSSFSWLSWVAYGVSEAAVVLWTVVYAFFPSSTLYGAAEELVTCPGFWFVLFGASVVCQLPQFVVRYASRVLRPTDTNIVQEVQKFELDDQLVDATETEGDHKQEASSPTTVPLKGLPKGVIDVVPDDPDVHLEAGSPAQVPSSHHPEHQELPRPASGSTRPMAILDEIPILQADLEPISSPGHLRSSSEGPKSPQRLMSPVTRLSIRSVPTPQELATPNSGTTGSSPWLANSSSCAMGSRRSVRGSTFASAGNLLRDMYAINTNANSTLVLPAIPVLSPISPGASLFSLMRTGSTARNRGFSFAQDEGAADVLASYHDGMERVWSPSGKCSSTKEPSARFVSSPMHTSTGGHEDEMTPLPERVMGGHSRQRSADARMRAHHERQASRERDIADEKLHPLPADGEDIDDDFAA